MACQCQVAQQNTNGFHWDLNGIQLDRHQSRISINTCETDRTGEYSMRDGRTKLLLLFFIVGVNSS
jgi:hypothetical protein